MIPRLNIHQSQSKKQVQYIKKIYFIKQSAVVFKEIFILLSTKKSFFISSQTQMEVICLEFFSVIPLLYFKKYSTESKRNEIRNTEKKILLNYI